MLLGGMTGRTIGEALVVLAVFILAFASRRPKQCFLFLWVLALTYDHAYFSLDPILGNNGSQGFYWIPGDVCFAVLLILWVVDLAIIKRPQMPSAKPLWRWFLPYAFVCLITAAVAIRPDWVLYGSVRIFKFALVLLYLRYNLQRKDWWVIACGFAFAVIAQSTIGILSVMTGHQGGLLSLFGIAHDTYSNPKLAAEIGMFWNRATGTMVHPNILANYFLLTLPLLLALALVCNRRELRWLFGFAYLIGFAALALTLSRIPWVIGATQAFAVLVGAAVLKAIPWKRAMFTIAAGILIVGAMAIPFKKEIMSRLGNDVTGGVNVRVRYDKAALNLAASSPFLGIGLNNTAAHKMKGFPDIRKVLREAEPARKILHIRVLIPVHNFYLFLLSETGIFGLGAFLLFLLQVVRVGLRSLFSSSAVWRTASLGILVAILGDLLQQVGGISLWFDPIFFTFAILIAMLAAGEKFGEREVRVKRAEAAAHEPAATEVAGSSLTKP